MVGGLRPTYLGGILFFLFGASFNVAHSDRGQTTELYVDCRPYPVLATANPNLFQRLWR